MALKETLYTDSRAGDHSYEEERGRREAFLTQVPAWLASMAVHTALLLTLALLTVGVVVRHDPLIGDLMVDPTPVEDEAFEDLPPIELWEDPKDETVEPLPTDDVTLPPDDVFVETTGPSDDEASPLQVQVDVNSPELGMEWIDPSKSVRPGPERGFGKRNPKDIFPTDKPPRDDDSGPNLPIARALRWIAEHQYANGGWNFDHTAAPRCQGKCGNPGAYRKAVNGATAIALLPFLGCGVTHKDGPPAYRKTVDRGLYFLINRMKSGGSFHEEEGTMYSHGLAAICLTEAYGMTRDQKLRAPAQGAINFIVQSQDPGGGGWRYHPRQQGDTSVVGWQLMALKSGYMAYLSVPATTSQKAMRFLDSVQANNGANYGYLTPSTEAGACTAIGLLSRMYYGWGKDNPALESGVRWLDQKGPSPHDMYYNYYASQVMHHYGGAEWHRWNRTMRTMLEDTQVTDRKSHENGSWFAVGGHDHGTDKGGRLYKTALATMTLEVYFRYAPIYKQQSVSGGLEL